MAECGSRDLVAIVSVHPVGDGVVGGAMPARFVPPLTSPCGRMACHDAQQQTRAHAYRKRGTARVEKYDIGVKAAESPNGGTLEEAGRISDARPGSCALRAVSRGWTGISRTDTLAVSMRPGVAHCSERVLKTSSKALRSTNNCNITAVRRAHRSLPGATRATFQIELHSAKTTSDSG